MEIKEMINTSENFLEIIETIDSTFRSTYNAIGDCDEETTDLLHECEAADNASNGDKLEIFNKLAEVRKRRRLLKNDLEEIRPLKEMLEKSSSVKTSIANSVRAMQSRVKSHKNFIYNPRIRNDLKFVHNAGGRVRPKPTVHANPELISKTV